MATRPVFTRLGLGIAAALMLGALLWLAAAREDERLAASEAGFAGRSVENGAAVYAAACAGCHGVSRLGVPDVAPALSSQPFFTGRLTDLNYQGDLRSYIEAAAAAGRPVPSGQYSSTMPAWGAAYGGTLRPDQLRDIAGFVLGWKAAPVATASAASPPAEAGGPAARGKALYGSLDCLGCHGWPDRGGITGPDLAGVAARGATQMRGLGAEEYLRVALLAPSAHIVADCPTGPCPDMMPRDYGVRLSQRDLELLVRYLLTLADAPRKLPRPGAPPPLVGGLATVAPTAVSPISPLARGHELYDAHCGMCHGDQGQGGMGTALAAALISVDPLRYARAVTAQGAPGMMPAWAQASGGPLTDPDLDNVAAYVVDLIAR